ncbi:hypothetical protein MAR_008788 [Mya arenaria]|uniref:Uncharacterized protein n=1 Tax=Mya arenaria TaxID=6604 RepID=A0ABY7DZW2_MYAAR|nr:hypothetical protein MAR_008788 [Mya arenaria]
MPGNGGQHSRPTKPAWSSTLIGDRVLLSCIRRILPCC